MNVVILAGGKGTRLSEETVLRPKPMVEIGARPILWHIMKSYAHYGHTDFTLALGYKGDFIKEYFIDYYHHESDLTVDLKTGKVEAKGEDHLDWKVHLVDTGAETMTGGRLGRLRDDLYGETFMLTYGDGVADIDINSLLAFHRSHGKAATITAVRPSARFGSMIFDGDRVSEFKEKPQTGEGWINGGFFVFDKKVFDYISGDATVLEGAPLEGLAADGELVAYKHEGFWQCMDTMRDNKLLTDLWSGGGAPWKVWND